MSHYSVDASRTVKVDLTIKYECEHCGRDTSYTQTYDQSITESGVTSRKSKAEANQLSKELSSKTHKFAQEIAEEWKKEGPTSFEYHIRYEACPNCGYTQSWMQKYLKQRRRSKYLKWPIVIISFAYWLWFFGGRLETILQELVGDMAGPAAFGIWAVLAGLTFLFGRIFVDPNRKFADVVTVNEPAFLWGDPVITG